MRARILLLLLGILIIVVIGIFFLARSAPPPALALQPVKIGEQIFNLRVAETGEARERGLGGTPSLARDEGMLFTFPEDGSYAIWMKDMLMPIDILWIDRSGAVIDARENVSPDSFPAIFTPQSPARFVVELSAGAAKAFHIVIGSRATFMAK